MGLPKSINRKASRPVLALAAVTLLAACSAGGWTVFDVGIIERLDREFANGPEHAFTPTTMHPVFVDSEVNELPLQAAQDFDPAKLDGLQEFADNYLKDGEGMLDVAVSLGPNGESRLVAHAESIAKYLRSRGVPKFALNIRAVENGDGEAITLRYERVAVRLPECGRFSLPSGYNSRNLYHENYGCATRRNLGVMASNPKNLLASAKSVKRDAGRSAMVVRAYRSGKAAGSSYDLTTTAVGN